MQDLVRELVIAHAQPGLHKVYDQYAYLDEKREVLSKWENLLFEMVGDKHKLVALTQRAS